jgi:hypothetical protein
VDKSPALHSQDRSGLRSFARAEAARRLAGILRPTACLLILLPDSMLLRVQPPGYQISLLLFLQNSAMGTVEKVGRDAVRISDVDPVRLTEALTLWRDLNQLAEVEFAPDA